MFFCSGPVTLKISSQTHSYWAVFGSNLNWLLITSSQKKLPFEKINLCVCSKCSRSFAVDRFFFFFCNKLFFTKLVLSWPTLQRLLFYVLYQSVFQFLKNGEKTPNIVLLATWKLGLASQCSLKNLKNQPGVLNLELTVDKT